MATVTLIDTIQDNENFIVNIKLEPEMYYVIVKTKSDNKTIFSMAKIKCCRENLQLLKQLFSAKLLQALQTQNLTNLLT